MQHKLRFYPVGNGDTSQIILENGRRLLFDFRHTKTAEDDDNPQIDLAAELLSEFKAAKRDRVDVLALTHGDADHIGGSTEFFELRHASKYQGAGRIKIDELWVPAAMILEESGLDGRGDEVIVWRQEARYRLREGKGIRVFSRPDKLKSWLDGQGLSVASRAHLIVDAGTLVPGFTLEADGLEFFSHSPFVKHVDDTEVARNEASLVFNVRFAAGEMRVDYFAVGDAEHENLTDIVEISEYHGNIDRLCWDLFSVPHHCSYLALSDEKGATVTTPVSGVAKLLKYARKGAHIVSSSKPIPDTAPGYESVQPPHIQARKCYEKFLREANGARLLVTMEEPNPRKPQPIEFTIDEGGVTLLRNVSGAARWAQQETPRAG